MFAALVYCRLRQSHESATKDFGSLTCDYILPSADDVEKKDAVLVQKLEELVVLHGSEEKDHGTELSETN